MQLLFLRMRYNLSLAPSLSLSLERINAIPDVSNLRVIRGC